MDNAHAHTQAMQDFNVHYVFQGWLVVASATQICHDGLNYIPLHFIDMISWHDVQNRFPKRTSPYRYDIASARMLAVTLSSLRQSTRVRTNLSYRAAVRSARSGAYPPGGGFVPVSPRTLCRATHAGCGYRCRRAPGGSKRALPIGFAAG